jgi:hypothetical protein
MNLKFSIFPIQFLVHKILVPGASHLLTLRSGQPDGYYSKISLLITLVQKTFLETVKSDLQRRF